MNRTLLFVVIAGAAYLAARWCSTCYIAPGQPRQFGQDSQIIGTR